MAAGAGKTGREGGREEGGAVEDRASTQTPQQASHKWQQERVILGGREGGRGSGGQGVDPNPAAGISQVAAGAGKTGREGGREG